MHKYHVALLAAVCSSAMLTAVHAAPEGSTSPAQQGQTGSQQTLPAQAETTGAATSSGGSGVECPPNTVHAASERLEPPGPPSRSGSATAMTDGSGTIGSTGQTRASSTSGATGTTGDVGSYTHDPSGSVTTSGATGAPIDSSVECEAEAGTGASGPAGKKENSSSSNQSSGHSGGQAQTESPASHSNPHK